MGRRGQNVIDEKLKAVLGRAWVSPFSTKSDYARSFADYIAIAAARGLLTTQGADGMFGRAWLVTPRGLRLLWGKRIR